MTRIKKKTQSWHIRGALGLAVVFAAGLFVAGAFGGVSPLGGTSSGATDTGTSAASSLGAADTGTSSSDTTSADTTTSSQTASTVPYIVTFASGTSTNQQTSEIAAAGATDTGAIAPLSMHTMDVPSDSEQAVVSALQSDADVADVERDHSRDTATGPSDPLYSQQWWLPQIGWDNVFGNTLIPGTATVAILDTGVDASHPDLSGVVVPGEDAITGSGDGQTDPNGHGTEMAGIVAAATDNGIGVAGVGFGGVQLMPVTVLGADGSGYDSDVISGVVYAVEHHADVILMAFSNPGYSPALQSALDWAWSQGVVLVSATGNDGTATVNYPAGDAGVMGIGSTGPNDVPSAFSNNGPDTFLAAPGENVLTTSPGATYTEINGTSASAAEVAGAAALMKAASLGSLTNDQIDNRLAESADPAGDASQTGNGRLNLGRAINDTSTSSIEPSGAPPTGDGGPFVGPYTAAASNLNITFGGTGGGSISITVSAAETITYPITGSGACTGASGRGTNSVTIVGSCNLNISGTGTTASISVTPNGTSTFGGWSPTLGTCTGNATSCSTGPLGGGQTNETATFNLQTATKLAFTVQPSNTVANTSISPAVKVSVEDSANNVVTGSTAPITLAIGTNPSSGTLSGTTTVNAVSGVATFSNLSINKTGTGYTVTATSSGLTSATSNPFNITARSTSTSVSCSPNPVTYGNGTTCTATVTDSQSGGTATTPAGTVAFGSSGSGSFSNSGSCTLASGSCSVTYTPSAVGTGTHTITATYTSNDGVHSGGNGNAGLTVNKANPDCSSIAGYTVTYDGHAHTATGHCQGVGSDGTLAGLNLSGTTHTNAGTYSNDPWTFTDASGNYNNTSGSVNDKINQAGSTVTVTCTGTPFTYSGSPQGCTASWASSSTDGMGASLTVSYSGRNSTSYGPSASAPTNAGDYTGSASFGGDANHNGSNNSTDFAIQKADSTTTVICAGTPFIYNGSPQGCIASVTGVGGLNQSLDVSYTGRNATTYGPDTTAPANAGDYTGSASFGGDANHTSSNNSAYFSIDKADSTVTVDCSGTPFTYDATAHGCTASWASSSSDGEGDTLAVNYSGRNSTSYGPSASAPTNAGEYTGSASFGGDANHNGSNNSTDFVIQKAGSTVTVDCSGTPFTYDATPHGCTASWASSSTDGEGASLSTVSYTGRNSTSYSSTTAPSNAGDYTGSASFGGDANHTGSNNSTDFVIQKAGSTMTVDCTGTPFTYNGNPQGCTASWTSNSTDAEDASLDVTYNGRNSTSYGPTTDAPSNAGDYTGSASFGGDANHTSSNNSTDFVIQKADATVSVDCSGDPFTYDGNQHGCTASWASTSTDAEGASLDVSYNGRNSTSYGPSADAPTNAGDYTGSASFGGDTNHNGSNNSTDFVIQKADATCPVTAYSVTYDGDPHTATGFCYGVGGTSDTLAGLDLTGTSHTNAGTYNNDPWTFTDQTGNYNDQGGTVDDKIDQAGTTTTVDCTGTPFTYNGNPQGCTASWTSNSTDAEGASLDVTYNGRNSTSYGPTTDAPSNAGDYTGSASFGGDANHTSSNNSTDFVIQKADATCSVSGYSLTYDGSPHTASGSCSGVGTDGTLPGLDLSGTTHTNAGTYADSWTFTDQTGNYNDQGPNPITDKIDPAGSTTTVDCSGTPFTYNANPHGCTAAWASNSTDGEHATLTVTYTGRNSTTYGPSTTAPTNAGDYTGSATFTGDANHNGSNNSTNFTINKATSTVTVTCTGTPFTYNANPHGCTAAWASNSTDGEHATLTVTYTGRNSTTYGPSTTAPTNAGDYTGSATFTGDANHNGSNNSTNFTINKATSTVTVTCTGTPFTYNANPHGCTAAWASNSTDGEHATLTVTYTGRNSTTYGPSTTAPTNAGDYTGSATFTGDANHTGSNNSTNFTINKADPTCSVTGYSVTFDGNPHTATGSCYGVGGPGNTLTGLNLSGTTHTLVGTYADTWTFTDSTGNYNYKSGTVTDTIQAWTALGKGFYPPVGIPNSVFTAAPNTPPLSPTAAGVPLNTVKGGQTVPMKFNIFAGSVEKTGNDAFLGSNPTTAFQTSKMSTCASGLGTDEIDYTTTSGQTTLRYDTTGMQWIQNWATPKVGQTTCYRTWVTFADGSTLEAFFQLNK